MNNLLSAGFLRLKKDPAFLLCALFMFAAGVFVAVKTGEDVLIDRTYFVYAVIIGLASSVFCGLFIGAEHGDGTLRNKLIVGHTKTAVYLSNLIITAVVGIIFCAAYLVPMSAIGFLRLGLLEMPLEAVALMFGISFALSAAYSAIFTLVSMLCRNKAVVAAGCLLIFIALIGLAAIVNSRLQEPEFIEYYSVSFGETNVSSDELQNGSVTSEPNPNYLAGQKREIYQFFLDFLPTGQSLQFADQSFVHTWQLPLYSLVIIAATTIAGIAVFRKKDTN